MTDTPTLIKDIFAQVLAAKCASDFADTVVEVLNAYSVNLALESPYIISPFEIAMAEIAPPPSFTGEKMVCPISYHDAAYARLEAELKGLALSQLLIVCIVFKKPELTTQYFSIQLKEFD